MPSEAYGIESGRETRDREAFKHLAKPGEKFDEDWVDALHEKVGDEGVSG
jgi:hypothetical protein